MREARGKWSLLLLFFLAYRTTWCYAWSFDTENSRANPQSRTLTCLCNDNNQCVVQRPQVNTSFISTLEDFGKPMGFCITSAEGRCYTAKDINIGVSNNPVRMRRFVRESARTRNLGRHRQLLLRSIESAQSHPEEKRFNVDQFIHVRYGCLSSDQEITFACNGHLVKHLVPKTIACCNSSDFCNANLTPEFFHHSSNEDAIRTALKNQKFFRKPEVPEKRKRLNPGLNIGPQLLSGGSTVNDETAVMNNKVKKGRSSTELNLFYFVLIISFTIVAVILLSTLAIVCLVYNCRIRRNQSKDFHAVLLSRRTHKDETILKKNTFLRSNTKVSLDSNVCRTNNKMNLKSLGSGTTYQTLSTNSTQNAESVTESQPSNGLPSLRLRQQTISNQVCLQKLIGSGRFSDVWIGSWHGESVLVKIFIPDDQLAQSLWRRTASLHRSMLLRHHTIQGLMAVDWIDYPGSSQSIRSTSHLPSALIATTSPRAMLIGELHPWGSLQDLMATHRWSSRATRSKQTTTGVSEMQDAVTRVFTVQRNSGDRAAPPALTTTDELMLKILLRMAISITQGLCFLHSEFAGTRGKPALAHRNLKPSNIFVRSDWTCCIGDIGFAVRPPPCPLPIPLVELHTLYGQYVSQLDRSQKCPTVSNGGTDRSGREDVVSERTRLMQSSQTNAMATSATSGDQSNTKLTTAKAELLDWWPVGGLCAGTVRYLAPELLAQSVDPFCFEAHQKADIYSLGLILWELFAWALPQTFRFHHEPCEQCRGSESSRSSAQSNSLTHTLDRSACPRHCLIHVAYEVELRSYPAQSLATSVECDRSIHTRSERQVELVNSTVMVQQGEPDLQTMHHLVCELNIRPQLPLITCGPWSSVLLQHSFHPGWMSVEPIVDSEHYRESAGSKTFVQRCHSTIPECVTVHPKKHVDSASYSSTSSGASSLQGTHSGSHSTSTEHAHPSISSTELTQLMCLVARNWASLLPECWARNPDARLTAQRIRKVLQKMVDNLDLFRMSRSETPTMAIQSTTVRPTIQLVSTSQRSNSSTIKQSS